MKKKEELKNEEVKDQESKDQEPQNGDYLSLDEAFDHVKKEMTLEALKSGLPLDEDVIVQATCTAIFDMVEEEHEIVSKELIGKLMYDSYKLGMRDVHTTIATILDFKEREKEEDGNDK